MIALAYALQLLFRSPLQGNDFSLGQYFDIVGRLDAIDEAMKSVTEEELNDRRTRPDRHRRAGCHIRITAWNNPALVDLVAS